MDTDICNMILKTALRLPLFSFLLVFGLAAGAGSAFSGDAQTPCSPVAAVFGRTICLEEINQEGERIAAMKKESGESGLDSAQAVQGERLDSLKDMIWQEALSHKFDPAVLEPTEEEVSLYRSRFKQSLLDNYEKHKDMAEKVKALLAQGPGDAEKEQKLRDFLRTLETSISFYEEKESYSQTMPPEYREMLAGAERDMARVMLRKWKEDKALYEAYGGRVLSGEGGAEPVEAYGMFIDYIKKEGKLSLLDPAFKDVFAQTEAYIAAAANIVPKNETPEGVYFQSPFGDAGGP